MKQSYLLVALTLVSTIANSEQSLPMNASKYFQDYMKSAQPPGFKLAHEIKPTQANKGQYFFKATYDGLGRIVLLETYAPPMCVEARETFTYNDKGKRPATRKKQIIGGCSLVPRNP